METNAEQSCTSWCSTVRNRWNYNFRNVSSLAKVSAYEKNNPPTTLPPQSTADPGKCRNNRSSGWWVPPHCCHCSLSLGAGPTALCSSNYQVASGGTLPVSALVDTGTEVTVLQGDIALNEEICALGGSSTLLSKPRLL